MQEENFYIIAAGGYLPRPIVEEIKIKESEMAESEDDFADFEDYKTYILDEAAAEFEQRFAKAIILTEAQAKQVGVYLPK
jgi:hypothetical protein